MYVYNSAESPSGLIASMADSVLATNTDNITTYRVER